MILRLIKTLLVVFIGLSSSAQEVLILGIAQDAGHPQANCTKACCLSAFKQPGTGHKVSSIAISDGSSFYIIDATPDFTSQLQKAKEVFTSQKFGGIILTHAHIGHYTGLMYLGREALNASSLPVYVMPKMKAFLENNGPWSQLVQLKNIELIVLNDSQPFELSQYISITPMLVPHRDEFSETAGYSIAMNEKQVLFIPDIDKWERWEKDIKDLIERCDYAFLDATFFDGDELPGRNISEVPHPFVIESMELFAPLTPHNKEKIHFTHFNHSNPLLNDSSAAYKATVDAGFLIARENQVITLK